MADDVVAMILGVSLVVWVMWAFHCWSDDLCHDLRALRDTLADRAPEPQ